MKAKHIFVILLVLGLGAVMTGCANLPTKQSNLVDTTCSNSDTNAIFKSGDYKKKVDNFLLIQDTSSTMSEEWNNTFYYDSSKLAISKDLANCLNNTLPDNFDVNAGMRVFGVENGLLYGMTKYKKEALSGAVNSLGKTGGVSPLGNAITNGSNDLSSMSGNAAVIIFSDGLSNQGENPAGAASAMKEMYGDNVCIYTVHIGGDPKGARTLQQVADAGKCGYATDLATVGKAQGMNNFVADVFLTKVAKKPAPVMKKPAPQKPVMKKPVEKVSMTLDFEFDFDKDTVRPDQHDDAKKIADSMKKYPGAQVLLEGHTDHTGTDEYNMDLSKRRADSVKRYLVDNFNVDAARISTVGYGKTRPVASNSTAAGRQKNRRVVANIE